MPIKACSLSKKATNAAVNGGSAAKVQGSAPVTTVAWVRNVVDALTECGLDGMVLSQEAGIPPALYSTPDAVIPALNIARLWDLALDRSGNPAVGLQAAYSFQPASMDALGYLMMSSTTLRESLERGVRYHGSHSNATHTTLVHTESGCRLEFHIMKGIIGTQRQNHDFIMLGCLKFIRFIAGQDLNPVLAEFMYAMPDVRVPYDHAFQCALSFSAPRTALTFSLQDMDRPLITANPMLAAVLEKSVADRMATLGLKQTTIWVRQLIAKALPDSEPGRDRIAETMNISPRKLQRKLQEEGTSFSEILDEVRYSLAQYYLGSPGIPLTDVASLLGFSEQSTFTRASRRWFGKPPNKMRVVLTAPSVKPAQK